MEQSRFSNQIKWYSFILCILVVLIHTQNTDIFTGQLSIVNEIETFVVEKIARPANAGFFLCSGYLFYRNFDMSRLIYKWKRRLFSTVVPFMVWNLAYYVIHLIISKMPVISGYFNDEAVFSGNELFQAIVNCKYNQIFWFLQFLIVYIYICPVIYLLIRNKYTGLSALLGILLLVGSGYPNQFGGTLSSMVNWVFIYMAGGYLGLHGRRWIESLEKRKDALIVISIGVAASHTYFRICPGIVGQLLCFLFDAMFLWSVLSYVRLPETRWWMKDTFYIYAVHFMIVRVGNKLAYACAGDYMGMGLWMFLLLPVFVVLFCGCSGRLLKRYTPFLWKILSGDR